MSSAAQTSTPPRFPRAMFIAAFAIAGAASSKLRPQPIARMTDAREQRRDRSITHIARHLGRSIIATGAASEAFFQRGGAYAPPKPAQRRVDVALLAISASDKVAGLIGRVGLAPSLDAPWVEVDRTAATPHVRIFWRGDLMRGDRMVSVFAIDPKTGLERVEQGRGELVGSSRLLDMERFTEAVEAAKSALRKSGVRLSSFSEVRRLNTPSLSGGDAFKGAVAVIGLARVNAPIVVLVK